MIESSWQEKAEALNALAELDIKMRAAGDWYIHQDTEVGGDGMLTGTYGNGASPADAINDHWRVLVDELPLDKYIVVSAWSDGRKHFRWNGFMWRQLPIKDATK